MMATFAALLPSEAVMVEDSPGWTAVECDACGETIKGRDRIVSQVVPLSSHKQGSAGPWLSAGNHSSLGSNLESVSCRGKGPMIWFR